jgi:molybdopterin-guanine dinucleotide biosynthesis protein A
VTSIKYTYHIHELAISGKPSNCKSILIQKLFVILSSNYKVYKEISDMRLIDQKIFANDYDFAIIDDQNSTEIKKILLLENNHPLDTEFKNVVAFISSTLLSGMINGKPSFHIDDIEGIKNFILNTFSEERNAFPLNALILTGGLSSRMGHDKSEINYHGLPQAKYLADLASKYCHQVFFSCRAEQAEASHLQSFPQILDNFLDQGPVGGILSYFKKYPHTRLLVLACDMPFIETESIENLISELDHFKVATVFENIEKKWPEPLFAIYHPKAQARFLQLMSAGYNCPMKMLFNSTIKTIIPKNRHTVLNGNTPEELLIYKNIIMESLDD